MTRPTIPEHLAIIFPIDNYDAWRYLAYRHLYLPSTAKTATGVLAVGLTGNLSTSGPIGTFWEDGKAILMMPGRDVQRINQLSPILYDNVDALVADNFRALRRIVDQPFVSFIATYTAEALILAANPAVAPAIFGPAGNESDELSAGSNAIEALSTTVGKVPGSFYKSLYDAFTATAGTYYTFNDLVLRLNRFAAQGAEMLISTLSKKTDDDPVFYWTPVRNRTPGQRSRIYIGARPSAAAASHTITLGQLKRGAAMLRSTVPPNLRLALHARLADEGAGFSEEVEWLANPTPDRRTGALSVFVNVPPGSVLYLIDRSLFDVESKVLPISLGGIWVVSIENDMGTFETMNQAFLDMLHDYREGVITITALRKQIAKFERKFKASVLEPNPYWLVGA